MLSGISADGLSGQFVLGLLLGVVWSPCVGPTLGAAITLASQGERLTQVALVMALFGLGAGLPLVALGAISRQAIVRYRGRLLAAGRHGKKLLGGMMLILGVFILTGADKRVESWILDVAPAWLTQLGTRL
jgi:cytochrome c biogenesis protein CcdA